MKALDETLFDRVDDLIRAHRGQRLLSTTGSQTALAELATRMEGLEKAVREIAVEVQTLRAP
jgi:hypothetical protein